MSLCSAYWTINSLLRFIVITFNVLSLDCDWSAQKGLRSVLSLPDRYRPLSPSQNLRINPAASAWRNDPLNVIRLDARQNWLATHCHCLYYLISLTFLLFHWQWKFHFYIAEHCYQFIYVHCGLMNWPWTRKNSVPISVEGMQSFLIVCATVKNGWTLSLFFCDNKKQIKWCYI